MKLYYSTVASATDVRPKQVKTTWPDLVRKFKRPQIRGNVPLEEYLLLPRPQRAKLKNGPGWIGGTFIKGGGRNDADLNFLYFFIGDCDNTKGLPVTANILKSSLKGYEAIIHTTYSHSTDKPKYRFVVPLSTRIRPKKYRKIFDHFNELIGGGLDPKGKTPSQLYFWPSVPSVSAAKLFEFYHLRGESVDPSDIKPKKEEDKKEVSVELPDELPQIDIEGLELSSRIKELIKTGVDPHKRYTSRSEALFAVVIALMSRGMSDADIAGICLDKRYGISEKPLEQKNPRKHIMTTLRKSRGVTFVGDAETVDKTIAELNTKHAIVSVGGHVFVLTETEDPVLKRKEIVLGYERDIKLLYRNKRLMVNEKPTNIADLWLAHESRRQYDRIIFSPEQDVPGCYNLWRGFSVEPQAGDCSLYLNHVFENISQGDEEIYKYIIAFMADAVQNPTVLPGVTLVMRGGEGVGKGVFASEFGRLFGQHYIQVTSSKHLVGNFNAHLKDALIVFADEAFYAGDKSVQGVLNAMITEAVRVIEHKGKDVITIPNFIRLIMGSNHDWIVPAGPNARRFFVVDVGTDRQQDVKYFKAIRRQMNNGGREALLDYLMKVDLRDIELRHFPRTQALVDQQLRSMGAEEAFWVDRLRRGELINHAGKWDFKVKCHALHEQFTQFAQKAGYTRRAVETVLGISIRKLCPEVVKARKKDEDNDRTVNYYLFPDLKRCRELFENHMQTDINWKL